MAHVETKTVPCPCCPPEGGSVYGGGGTDHCNACPSWPDYLYASIHIDCNGGIDVSIVLNKMADGEYSATFATIVYTELPTCNPDTDAICVFGAGTLNGLGRADLHCIDDVMYFSFNLTCGAIFDTYDFIKIPFTAPDAFLCDPVYVHGTATQGPLTDPNECTYCEGAFIEWTITA